ncbi:hypothetical protein ACS5PN_27090 [Roseateles sp. NT4]|uniref:hypothetical protein n=1 Tax=Roseateles sp. NT4 TaxID=3453715 RepID=UPI003EEFBAAE
MNAPIDLATLISDTVRLAHHDYAGARCCFRNSCVIPGFVLAQQATEKLLKAIVYERSGETRKLGAGTAHDLEAWANEAVQVEPKLRTIQAHTALLRLLTQAFDGKYADAKNRPTQDRSSEHLEQIDALIAELLRHTPALPFFLHDFVLGVVQADFVWPPAAWAVHQNPAVLQALEDRYADVGDVLMGAVRKHAGYAPVVGWTALAHSVSDA